MAAPAKGEKLPDPLEALTRHARPLPKDAGPPQPEPPFFDVPKDAKEGEPRLLGVLWAADAARRVAIVNRSLLKVGDDYRGAKLQSISEDQVVFVRGGRRVTLALRR